MKETNYHIWTSSEEKMLIERYAGWSHEEMKTFAGQIGVSLSSLRVKANRLGINRNRQWKSIEVKLMMDYYQKKGGKTWLMNRLDVDANKLYSAARRFGCNRKHNNGLKEFA